MTDFPLILVKRLKALLMFRTREIAILIVEIRLLAFEKARMLVPVSLRYPDRSKVSFSRHSPKLLS